MNREEIKEILGDSIQPGSKSVGKLSAAAQYKFARYAGLIPVDEDGKDMLITYTELRSMIDINIKNNASVLEEYSGIRGYGVLCLDRDIMDIMLEQTEICFNEAKEICEKQKLEMLDFQITHIPPSITKDDPGGATGFVGYKMKARPIVTGGKK